MVFLLTAFLALISPNSKTGYALNNLEYASDNPGVVQIAATTLPQFHRVIALSDVHGMLEHTTALLQAAGVLSKSNHWTGGKTLLIITGDSIDKGPQSLEVLALWMRLQKEAPLQKGRVIVLLGNHEAELLADPVGDAKTKALEAELVPKGLHVADLAEGKSETIFQGEPLSHYSSFLRSLPIAARVGDWLFCHAGWVPSPISLPNPTARWQELVTRERTSLIGGSYGPLLKGDGNEFLERKEYPVGTKWWKSPEAFVELERRLDEYGLRGVVFGHSPTAFDIEDGIGYPSPNDHRLIKIDSGMAPEAGGFAGHLLLLPHPQEMSGGATLHPLVGRAIQGKLVAVPL